MLVFSLVNRHLDGPIEIVLLALILLAGLAAVMLLPGTWTRALTIEGIAGAAGIGLGAAFLFLLVDVALLQNIGTYTNRWWQIGGSNWWYHPIWWMVGHLHPVDGRLDSRQPGRADGPDLGRCGVRYRRPLRRGGRGRGQPDRIPRCAGGTSRPSASPSSPGSPSPRPSRRWGPGAPDAMRWVRLLFRIFGWLLTPFLAWAASFFGAVAGALIAMRLDDPFRGLAVTAICGAVTGFAGLVLLARVPAPLARGARGRSR